MTENKESKFFEPKEREEYFFARDHGGAGKYANNIGEIDKNTILRGVYRTEAEAIQADNVRLALKRVWDSADSAKYFFRPDWGDDKQAKHYCFYDHANKKFNWGCDLCAQGNPFLPHFKSSEDCLAFAKENEKDLRIIWGV